MCGELSVVEQVEDDGSAALLVQVRATGADGGPVLRMVADREVNLLFDLIPARDHDTVTLAVVAETVLGELASIEGDLGELKAREPATFGSTLHPSADLLGHQITLRVTLGGADGDENPELLLRIPATVVLDED